MKLVRITYKFISHFLLARNTRGFGVHSPYIFQFTHFILCGKHSFYFFDKIEMLRKSLKMDRKIVNFKDFGTGEDRRKSIAEIANHSLKSKKYGQLFFRLCNSLKAQNVLELGTSLGVTTAYLASSSSKLRCISLEGCPEIARIACDNFDKLGLKNIEVVVGNIDITLSQVLMTVSKLDFIFIDANHRSEAVLNYFEQCLSKIHNDTVLVIDDIYWSRDMETVWDSLKNHPMVTTTIDVFQMGIVFFNRDLSKKHYLMRF